MSLVPLDVRRHLWAWYYGRRAFEHCKACCDAILQEDMDEEHLLYYSLNVAAHINYGRPFKRSFGIGSLPEEIVPKRFHAAHKQVLATRDKLYAHTDVVGSPFSDLAQSVDIRVRMKNRQAELRILEITVKPQGIRNLGSLCDVLIVKATYHMQKILNRHGKDFPRGEGEYRIGVDPNEPPFSKV